MNGCKKNINFVSGEEAIKVFNNFPFRNAAHKKIQLLISLRDTVKEILHIRGIHFLPKIR